MHHFTFTPLCHQHMERNGYSAADMLGSIPDMLSEGDPDDAVAQIDRAYRPIGGGWRDMDGFSLDIAGGTLTYPGDRPRLLLAQARFRDELILFFNGAWIVVVQPDGSLRTACID